MRINYKVIIVATFGIFLTGIGVALNNCAGLGNDPIGIVYDGIRTAAKLNREQLGTASNLVNLILIILLVFFRKLYIYSLGGTSIYFFHLARGVILYSGEMQRDKMYRLLYFL